MAVDTPAVPAFPSFQIISKQIESAAPGPDGRRRFHLTASSTIEDRAGDEITREALEKAAQAFREGITIYIDHKFRQVDYAFGLTDSADVIQRGLDPKSGKPVWDLDVYGDVNTPNPRASRLADSIDGKYAKFGASITAFVRKHAKKPTGGMLISDIEPIEASVVGVPENQRSWAHKAALAVKNFGGVLPDEEEDEDDMDEPTAETPEVISKAAMSAGERGNLDADQFACPEKRKYPINDAAHVRAALSRIGDPSNDQCGREKIIAAARRMGIGEHSKSLNDEQLVSWALSEFPADRITVDADGQEVFLLSKEIDAPEPPESDESADEHSTQSEGGQESADEETPAEETPETAPADDSEHTETADEAIEKALGATDAEVSQLLGHVKTMVAEIGRLREENSLLVTKIATLEQRASLADEADDVAKAISKALELPLRPQAASYIEDARRSHPVFDPDVQEYLDKRSRIS